MVEQSVSEETEEKGFFKVEAILKHKYKQGWRFLTKWDGWPLRDATWEPVRAFVEIGGPINAVFKQYCEDHGLDRPLRQAIQRSTGESSHPPPIPPIHDDPDNALA